MNSFVYRVEHPSDSAGPYICKKANGHNYKRRILSINMCYAHRNNMSHPSVSSDVCDFERGIDVCAFDRLEKLYLWFDGFIEELKGCGYQIVEIEICKDDIKYGKSQCAFSPYNELSRKIIPWEISVN